MITSGLAVLYTVLWWMVNGVMFLVFFFVALAILTSAVDTAVKSYYTVKEQHARATLGDIQLPEHKR